MHELIFELPRYDAEKLSDALMAAGVLSVTVEDADAQTPDEIPLFGEPGMLFSQTWQRHRLTALLDNPIDLGAVLSFCGFVTQPTFVTREVMPQDWVRFTQTQWQAFQVGKRIQVTPSWEDPPPAIDTDMIVLQLDPGLAFGTGTHPTTRLCMRRLETLFTKNIPQRVLDYGCGSGILSILAQKLGAQTVVGVDIDPQAITATLENATRNGCEINACLPEIFKTTQGGSFEVVLANILAGPLITLAPLLCQYVDRGGQLVLSGILASQTQDIIQAYRPWIALSIGESEEDWCLLIGTMS